MFSLDDIRRYIRKYQPDGLIVDTNILILFLVGSYDINQIEKLKVLNNSDKKYSIDDFKLLKELFEYFKKIIIIPQVIAELSNLSITGGGVNGNKLNDYLQIVIKFLKRAEERHQQTNCLWGMELSVIGKYGFTDMTLFELSKQTKMQILTDEMPLYVYSQNKIPIIKFGHIKNQAFQNVFS